ncbi:MAG: hypothetical protein INH41_07190 [Myxococcaceae bacterium]|nr:hypothetical protein [Myxococcaceae bacterium]MCA3012170.1 hypothetical protein [Myxococcaceae bacterium]
MKPERTSRTPGRPGPGPFAAALSLLLGGCALRAGLGLPGDAAALPPAIADVVTCETGGMPVELRGFRPAVAAVLRSRWPDARVEAAALSCRLVTVGQRPVVVGSNTPSVLTLQEHELELSVEFGFSRMLEGCVSQRWLGRSRWRVVPLDAEGALSELVAEEARGALADAAAQAAPSSETRLACPGL